MMAIQQEIFQIIYTSNYYKLIGIDLSKQKNTSIPQQINFVGKLDVDDGAVIFYCLKAVKNYCNFFFNRINCFRIM